MILPLILSLLLQVQPGQHSVVLAWMDAKNSAGTTYNVKRATGSCSGTPAFTILATGVTALAYTDSSVTAGTAYCYEVTASLNGDESAPSNTVNPQVPAPPPPTVSIPIQNADFSQGTSGWQLGYSTGVTQLTTGGQAGYAGYGGTLSQTLAATPKQIQAPSPGWPYVTDGVYALTFSATNYYGVYPDYLTAEIDFGTQEFCKQSFWATQQWHRITMICPSPGYLIIDAALDDSGNSSPVQSSQPFVIHFTGGGWPVLFKNVSLTFSPN